MDASGERSGVKAWSQFLAGKPLPVKSQTIQRIKSALAKPSHSLQQLAPIIAADPAFTLHLIQKSNSLSHSTENQANSVDLAVSMLGMDHLKALIDEVPVIKLNPSSVPHRWYFRSLENSTHASVQAADFCVFPNPKVIADSKLAALFYHVGHWALWRYAPSEMSLIKKGIFEDSLPFWEAEKNVLGCTIREISLQLVRHWKLSKLATKALEHSLHPDDHTLSQLQVFTTAPDALSEHEQKSMRHLMSSQYYAVVLANWLVESVEVSWESDHTQLLQQCIADQLKCDTDHSRKRVILNAVSTSRINSTPGLLSTASLLLMLPSDQHLEYAMPVPDKGRKKQTTIDVNEEQLTKAPVESTLPAYLEEDTFKDKLLFQQACKKLLSTENGCENQTDICKLLVQGLKDALGFQRIGILKISGDGNISPMFLSGFSKQDPMRRFTQKLSGQGLLNMLSKKTAAISMDKNNRIQVKMQMSDRLKACTHQSSFALMSVHQNGKLRFYVYADHGTNPIDTSAFFFKYFKVINNAASKRLNQLAES